jgi:hypothetical protein
MPSIDNSQRTVMVTTAIDCYRPDWILPPLPRVNKAVTIRRCSRRSGLSRAAQGTAKAPASAPAVKRNVAINGNLKNTTV